VYEFLRKVPLFADLPESELRQLCEMVDEIQLSAGELLFEEGSTGDQAYVIKQGELEILKASSGRDVLLAMREPGEVIGEMSLFEDTPRMASVRARKDSVLFAIHKQEIDRLLQTSLPAASSMFYTILRRWRQTEAMLRQSEKLAQLGTLTAGVAHELNNPASAVKRGSSQLHNAVDLWSRATQAIMLLDLSQDQSDQLQQISHSAVELAKQPALMDALERSDREAETDDWLTQRGVADAYTLTASLVDGGYDIDQLVELESQFGKEALAAVVQWMAATYQLHHLLAEVQRGSERISGIVGALKSYAYLDQAPVQEVDIHKGLDETLLILQHKLKAGISVQREYDPALPTIFGYGSELNQAWTNLLDNALDALGESGEITIRTRGEADQVEIVIEDNGQGIPQDIQSKIFDPFFTTKPPGSGTGLGLDITYNIIVHKHRGDIELFSEPGRTQFLVRLPLNFESQ
jgi:signal transduction histidine kinase